MKRILWLTLAGSLMFYSGKAQQNHEFSLYGGGGLSTLNYNPAQGNLDKGFGGKVGLGYTYFLSPSWGIGTGLELSFYNVKANARNLLDSTLSSDILGGVVSAMYFKPNYTNYRETQRATYLQIPLMVQFQHPAFKQHLWYASAGVRVGITALSGTYKGSADQLMTSGYYPSINQEFTNWPSRGFLTITEPRTSGDLDFSATTALALEGGLKWRLSEKWKLYTGLYFDYGLNDVSPKHLNEPMVAFQSNNPTVFKYGSLLNTTRQSDGNVYNRKINTIAAGVNVRITFGTAFVKTRKQKKTGEAKEEEDALQVAEEARQRALALKEQEARVIEEQAKLAEEKSREEELKRLAEEKAEKERKEREADLEELGGIINNYACAVTRLTQDQNNVLDQKIAVLKKYPDVKITIEGHTCDIGTDAVNIRYGQMRANEIKAHMVSQGIEADRITAVSYGESRPVVPNTNEGNRRLNRRIEIKVDR